MRKWSTIKTYESGRPYKMLLASKQPGTESKYL